ncbi:MAG: methionine synthase [Bacteroidales bacterium]|jgi:5-methyltetrahydrofolate--homocysteine methyltransferase|nr:methionine synthase [Bacteroidales bacterium]
MTISNLQNILNQRILILDGAMGSLIQRFNLSEADYRGEQFAHLPGQLKGNNDMLCITRPDVIRSIHADYLEAGADIIETNSFSATTISMQDYGMEQYVRDINLSAARIAREIADAYSRRNPAKPRFVAGSVGPTNKSTSLSADVNSPASRAATFDEMAAAYAEQIDALIDGGVDVLLIETVFDTLNAKAALFAAEQVMKTKTWKIPVMLSATLSGKSGRLLSGQTLDALLASIQHAEIFSVGLNCSFGASDMKPFLKEFAKKAPCFISAHPNAGLPNRFGEYNETPEKMAAQINEYISEGLVNIIGGCCGTTPAHIAQYPALIENTKPHIPAPHPSALWLSGLELLEIRPENNFTNIGERCNVAGSRKFLRLIKEKKYEEALAIARKQVEDGAQIIDVNMDEGLLDATAEMTHFLNLLVSDPDVARVPVMIDSSSWNVIEAGLKCLQGKAIVNSISLKEGEAIFLQHAATIKSCGAAAVVMAFDEKGQADSFERKIEVCERAYHLLVNQAGFNPYNIIFDPNVLAIATGMETDANYAVDFIRAVEWIKANLPGAGVSGGISNLSFSFRGNDYIREAMHAVFLYHATAKGMDMGIVNPASSLAYEDIPAETLELLEDVILNRKLDATERLIEFAQNTKELVLASSAEKQLEWRLGNVEERLEHALIKGVVDFLEDDLAEALQKYTYAVDIIDKVLMSGMNKVGELFGAGKMFLPQVVKTARTMKKAVAILQPAIEAEKQQASSTKGKFLIATVKGDVHDIGKNIVSVVLSCNNYHVIDLGVMTPPEKIIQTAIDEKVDFIGLSGLITPSLEEMCTVAEEMERAGMTIPLLVGGATTSRLHTAVKIAPRYSGLVAHGSDASQCPVIASRLIDARSEAAAAYRKEIREQQAHLRESLQDAVGLLPLSEARKKALHIDWENYSPIIPKIIAKNQILSIPVAEVIPYINWRYFFTAWKVSGHYDDIENALANKQKETAWLETANCRDKAAEALTLYRDAKNMLAELTAANVCAEAIAGFYPACSDGDTIIIDSVIIPTLRQQTKKKDETAPMYSLSDFVIPKASGKQDYAGVFAATAGNRIEALAAKYEQAGDDYAALLLKSLADRIAEAASEYLHTLVRKDLWGYAPNENLPIKEQLKEQYQGIRPAIGYPSLPDQSLIFRLDKLLDIAQIGITLTENGAMRPNASTCGLFFAHSQATYFAVGRIDGEQLTNYASQKNEPVVETKKWLYGNIE